MTDPQDTPRWLPFRTVRRTREGKHIVDFSPDFPLLAECFVLEIDHHLTPNYHDYLEVVYVVQGAGICEVGSSRDELLPGDIVILGPADIHTFWSRNNNPVKFYALYFLPEVVYRTGEDFFNRAYLDPFTFDVERRHFHADEVPGTQLPDLLRKMYALGQERPLFYRHQQKALLLELLCWVRNSLFRSGMSENHLSREGIQRLEPLFRLVGKEYWRDIPLDEAANMVSLSRYHFCRFFRQVTGSTFIEYVHRVRMDRARMLLTDGDYPVSWIAGEVGFNSISFFNRVFRKLTGISPSEYRKIVRRSSEPE